MNKSFNKGVKAFYTHAENDIQVKKNQIVENSIGSSQSEYMKDLSQKLNVKKDDQWRPKDEKQEQQLKDVDFELKRMPPVKVQEAKKTIDQEMQKYSKYAKTIEEMCKSSVSQRDSRRSK
jgi:hypothetical protein